MCLPGHCWVQYQYFHQAQADLKLWTIYGKQGYISSPGIGADFVTRGSKYTCEQCQGGLFSSRALATSGLALGTFISLFHFQ